MIEDDLQVLNSSFQVAAADLVTARLTGSNILTLLPPASFAGHHITQVEVKSQNCISVLSGLIMCTQKGVGKIIV